jgi:hypothetical protein
MQNLVKKVIGSNLVNLQFITHPREIKNVLAWVQSSTGVNLQKRFNVTAIACLKAKPVSQSEWSENEDMLVVTSEGQVNWLSFQPTTPPTLYLNSLCLAP